jgi:hypothetical protein
LLGLGAVLGRHGGYYVSYSDTMKTDINLPRFSLPGIEGHVGETMSTLDRGAPGVHITDHAARTAAVPWQRLVNLWTMDAEAEPSSPPQKG